MSMKVSLQYVFGITCYVNLACFAYADSDDYSDDGNFIIMICDRGSLCR